MPFTFTPMPELPEVILVEPRVFNDERGWFMESHKQSDFAKAGIPAFVQENHASSKRGAVRALHWQNEPAAQGKLVRCIAGEVFDVGVDVRKGSPTFGRWTSATLSAENKRMLYIPPGFAHGLIGVSESSEIAYKSTREYSPQDERGLRWNDPAIGIRWPPLAPIVTKRDAEAPLLRDIDSNHVWRASP
jgi:dTDP-4-dehydrorhamnose 3,5-epimerase